MIQKLHPLERKILPFLKSGITLTQLQESSGMKQEEILRAMHWLENKEVLTTQRTMTKHILLASNGVAYQKNGLPERRMLQALATAPMTIAEVSKKASLNQQEVGISLGVLKNKQAIIMEQGSMQLSEQGKALLKQQFDEEKLLKKLVTPITWDVLSASESKAAESLLRRKDIVMITEKTEITITLTQLGEKLSRQKINAEFLDTITPTMLQNGSWKGKEFRAYDVESNVPRIVAGKKHHYRFFLDEMRKKFLSFGFAECEGPVVENEFWDMDALFMPQFHSARDIHQGYAIKEPKYDDTLSKEVVKRVKAAHEHGFGTGSKGWRYEFDTTRTAKYILRTQDTAISARTLASKDLKIPGKYFQMSRCFRYDVIDATHLSDFNQVGGFVVEENINFGHLKALLKMFAEEFAETDQIKIVPGYFPFTEPSAELFAKHPDLGWIELGGSGMFRPELVKPLVGKDVPVIAWGLGIDRIAMFKLGLKDIRSLFSHDLEFLRECRVK